MLFLFVKSRDDREPLWFNLNKSSVRPLSLAIRDEHQVWPINKMILIQIRVCDSNTTMAFAFSFYWCVSNKGFFLCFLSLWKVIERIGSVFKHGH